MKFPKFLRGFGQNGPKNAEYGEFSGAFGWAFVGECFLVACLFSLYAGSAAPEVNESHYLVKAKHFWEPDFASRDLFLASADAHWFFFATVGWLTHILTLPAAAWCGRILGWIAVAIGWCLFMRRLYPVRLVGAMTAPLWITSLDWGQLSGEWIIGGCEAKVFAYACCFIGLSETLIGRWSRSWYWFGLASGFHVLTGGWITLAALIGYTILKWGLVRRASSEVGAGSVEISRQDEIEPLRRQWLGLVIGGCLALLGLIPVLLLNRGIDASTSERGAMIYVFQRLPHHLSPLHFSSQRWIAFAVMVVVTLSFAGNYFRLWKLRSGRSMRDANFFPLMIMTGIVSLFAGIGVLIDWSLSSWATNWSACLLRFYWFRWNDVVWPTLLTLLAIATARNVFLGSAGIEDGASDDVSAGASTSREKSFEGLAKVFRGLSLLMLMVMGPLLMANRYIEHQRASLSPADQASLVMRSETPSMQHRVRDDWLDVCFWIRSSTPAEALFLTPRFQQTFKWYAHRAEVASWKDAPQDALGLIEWEKRMLEIFPKSPEGYGISMTDQHLRQMRLRYRIDYVVVDRRIQKRPPLLPLVHSNDTYAVFEFP